MIVQPISLLGVASYLPERVVHNDFFAEGAAARRGMFTAPTTRRHVAKDESAAQMIERASRRLIDRLNLVPERDIDVVLTNVAVPDQPFTGCGAEVVQRLGSGSSWVLDLHNSTVVSFGEWDVRTVVAGAVVLIVVLQFMLGGLKWGRWVYAVGSNPDAARQAALPVERVILGAFVASGALAGLAGFLFLSRFGTITVNAGNGLELQSVAAAVVGGVNIFGGSGTLLGALLGALLINLLDLSLLRVPGLSEFWRDAVLGALILTAVTVDFLLGKRLGRMSSRSRGRPTAGVPDA